jgi:hypothetical protein
MRKRPGGKKLSHHAICAAYSATCVVERPRGGHAPSAETSECDRYLQRCLGAVSWHGQHCAHDREAGPACTGDDA